MNNKNQAESASMKSRERNIFWSIFFLIMWLFPTFLTLEL